MQTLGNFIKQHGYASLDGCIELHSNGIFTDEVWLWRSKTALEGQLPGIKAQDFHGLLSAAIARIIEKGGHAVPAINGEGEALFVHAPTPAQAPICATTGAILFRPSRLWSKWLRRLV